MIYSMDNNDFYAPSDWIFKFQAQTINAMGLLEAGEATRCPNFQKEHNKNFWEMTDDEIAQAVFNQTKLRFGFHLLTGPQSYGNSNGGSGFTKWEKTSDDLNIPVITDRTVSPGGSWGTKIPHTKLGWALVDVATAPDISQFGCEGQNETSSHGGTKWVPVSKMKAFSSSSILGFWSDDY